MGEETLYSTKGHQKACDLRRQLVTNTIWACALLSVVGLVGINPVVDKWLSAFGLLGTIALLLWNEGEGKDYRAKHKEAAEKYRGLHKEIRECYYLENCSAEQISELSKAVIALDQSARPDIPGYARRLAKRAIEGKDPETDNWFLEKA